MQHPLKGIDWDEVPLGELPDTALARRFGVAHQVVWKARVRRGIARFAPESTRSMGSIDWDTLGLGEKPDRVIANELGIDVRKVCYERNKRRVRPFIGLVLTQEGDPCRSIYEAMYDAYLHDRRVEHEHEVRVPKLPFIADFRAETSTSRLSA